MVPNPLSFPPLHGWEAKIRFLVSRISLSGVFASFWESSFWLSTFFFQGTIWFPATSSSCPLENSAITPICRGIKRIHPLHPPLSIEFSSINTIYLKITMLDEIFINRRTNRVINRLMHVQGQKRKNHTLSQAPPSVSLSVITHHSSSMKINRQMNPSVSNPLTLTHPFVPRIQPLQSHHRLMCNAQLVHRLRRREFDGSDLY